MHDSFKREFDEIGADARVRIATGDYSDPIHPEVTDVLVSTYERFAGLLSMPELTVGRLVIDEAHMLADQTRGAVVEGLVARLRAKKPPKSICALSAVIANPQEIGDWLGLPLVLGAFTDRAVEVDFICELSDDVDGHLLAELKAVLDKNEQAIVFCNSKAASQKLARIMTEMVSDYLTEDDVEALNEVATRMAEDDEEALELFDLLSGGVSFHHAGLSRDSRSAVETAFREKRLKVIACTPTLAAGVNLPARLVVVRDVYRTEFVRGFPERVPLSTGELLNMLGRAGRPGQVERGRAVAIVKEGIFDEDEYKQLQIAISDGKGNPVKSRLPDSFDSLMRFLLSVTADLGEATLFDLEGAIRQTLWYSEEPEEIRFDRSFKEDMMEDIPSFARVALDMHLERAWPIADGVAGSIVSGDKIYNVTLRFSGLDCACPAKAKWHRQDVCKHLACAIHDLIFGRRVEEEIRSRAIYACAHRFRKTLDIGTKVREATKLLEDWGLLEPMAGGFRATSVGMLAANSEFDLLMLRTANDRVRKMKKRPSPLELAKWILEDYIADENKRDRWFTAIEPWLGEVDVKKIKLPERYRGDFENGLDRLSRLATLYGELAKGFGKIETAEACRLARGCILYGVASDLIPLMSLRLPQLGRARCRFLNDERGIRSLEDLANAGPEQIKGPRVPVALARQWVEQAGQMWKDGERITEAPKAELDVVIDNFLDTFKVDQLSLFGPNGLVSERQ
jgi:helicase